MTHNPASLTEVAAGDRPKWEASCTCGWSTGRRTARRTAIQALAAHLAMAAQTKEAEAR